MKQLSGLPKCQRRRDSKRKFELSDGSGTWVIQGTLTYAASDRK
jgi:hypothetical protein